MGGQQDDLTGRNASASAQRVVGALGVFDLKFFPYNKIGNRTKSNSLVELCVSPSSFHPPRMGQQHSTPARIPVRMSEQKPPSSVEFRPPVALDRHDEDQVSVPVMFKWTHGGQRVALTGTFNDWAAEGIPMVRSGQEFYQVVEIPKGVHEYKFLVDGEWKFSLDQPVLQDAGGNVNNVVDIQYYEKYEPAALRDPVEPDDETEFLQELIDPTHSPEPPSAPPLLVKLPGSVHSGTSHKILDFETIKDTTQTTAAAAPSVNIPLFSVCGHLVHDAAASYRGMGSKTVVCSSTIRFAQKYASTILLTLNTESDGFLRQYGAVANGGTQNIFQQALLGKEVVSPQLASGILRRANSSGSEGRSRSRNLDLSTFTD